MIDFICLIYTHVPIVSEVVDLELVVVAAGPDSVIKGPVFVCMELFIVVPESVVVCPHLIILCPDSDVVSADLLASVVSANALDSDFLNAENA